MANWHYDNHGQPTGPVSDDDLRALVASGAVTDATRVWTSGMADWQPAGTAAPHLFDAPAAPEPSFDPTPTSTFDPTPASTPEPSFDATPASTPEPTFDPTPEPTFDAPLDPTPEPTFDATPRPEPTFDATAAYAPAAAPSGPMWHYERAGQPAGPVPESELASLVERGTLSGSTRVWREGMADWQPARAALPALFGSPAAAGRAAATGIGGALAGLSGGLAGLSGGATGAYAEPGWLAFEGRIRRKTFGIRHLIMIAVSIVVIAPLVFLVGMENAFLMQGVSTLLSLVLLPSYAQRFRDVNQSGWLALLSVVPCLNLIVFLYLLFVEGTPGPNTYGPDPKGRG